MGNIFKKKFEKIEEAAVELVISESLSDLVISEPGLIESIEIYVDKCLGVNSKSCQELSEGLSVALGRHLIDNAAYFTGVMIETDEISGNLLEEMEDYYGDKKSFKTAVEYVMSKGRRAMPSNPEFQSGAGALVYNTLAATYFSPNA